MTYDKPATVRLSTHAFERWFDRFPLRDPDYEWEHARPLTMDERRHIAGRFSGYHRASLVSRYALASYFVSPCDAVFVVMPGRGGAYDVLTVFEGLLHIPERTMLPPRNHAPRPF